MLVVPLWALGVRNRYILIAAGFYMALPDLAAYAEFIYNGFEVSWQWYHYFHSHWFFAPHWIPDLWTHGEGKDWWILPPEGRAHWEIIGWIIILAILYFSNFFGLPLDIDL